MKFLVSGDFFFPLNLDIFRLDHLNAWSFQEGAPALDTLIRLPSRLILMLVSLADNNLLLSYFYIVIVAAISFAAFGYFVKNFTEVSNRIALVSASLFFAFNPAFLGNYAKIGLILAVSMLPLGLVVLRKALIEKRFLLLFLYILTLNVSLIHPFTFIINLLVGASYFLYRWWQQRTVGKFGWISVVSVAFVALFLHAYALLPIATVGSLDKGTIDPNVAQQDPTDLLAIAQTDNIVESASLSKDVLKDFDFYDGAWKYIYFAAAALLYGGILYGLFRCWPRLARTEHRLTVITSIGFVLAAWFVTGTDFGVRSIHEFLIGLPAGWAFRSPLKWQLYMPIFLGVVIALLLDVIWNDKKKLHWRKPSILIMSVAFIGLNGYLVSSIASSLLSPRSVEKFQALENIDFNKDTLGLVGGQSCRQLFRVDRSVDDELKVILKSKDLHVRTLETNEIKQTNLATMDYVLLCPGVQADTSNFDEIASFADNQLTLYKNQQEKSYISSLVGIQITPKQDDVAELANQLRTTRQANFNFYSYDILDQYDAWSAFDGWQVADLSALFSAPDIQRTDTAVQLTDTIGGDGQTTLTNSPNIKQIRYETVGERLFVYQAQQGSLLVNGTGLFSQEQDRLLFAANFTDGEAAIAIDDEIVQITAGTSGYFDVQDSISQLRRSENLLENGSFETGLWEETVQNCYEYDDRPIIDMRLRPFASDGTQALELETTRHQACTVMQTDIETYDFYQLDVDYASDDDDIAGFFWRLTGEGSIPTSNRMASSNGQWQTKTTILSSSDQSFDLSELYLYAYQGDGTQAKTASFDNIRLSGYTVVDKIDTSQGTFGSSETISLDRDTEAVYQSIGPANNLVENGSFENGTWQDAVSDCFNYDNDPQINMSLTENALDGDTALQLETTRHRACTQQKIPIEQPGSYRFQLSYLAQERVAGFQVSAAIAQGTTTLLNERLQTQEGFSAVDWRSFDATIQVPAGTQTITVTLYAYEDSALKPATASFDSIELFKVPNIEGTFFSERASDKQNVSTPELKFRTVHRSHAIVIGQAITDNFILEQKERFDSNWKLKLVPYTSVTDGCVSDCIIANTPGAGVLDSSASDDFLHLPINDYSNSWLIDFEKLQADFSDYIVTDEDGSVRFAAVLYYQPHRSFELGLYITLFALLFTVGLIVHDERRHQKYRAK